MSEYIFVGGIFPENHIEDIESIYGTVPQLPSETLQRNIIAGLEKNLNQHVVIINTYFLPKINKILKVKYYSWKSTFGINYNIPFINLKIVQHFIKQHNLKYFLLKYLDSSYSGKKHIIIYSAYFPFLLAVKSIKKYYNVDICLIISDLPQYMGLDCNQGLYRKISRILSKHLFETSCKAIDSFVFLTKHMNSIVNKNHKKFVVVEGIPDKDYGQPSVIIHKEKQRVLYSGTLQYQYGIRILINAIAIVKKQDVEFVFYGIGEGCSAILNAAKADSRIKYMGTIARKQLYYEQQQSTLLINPRQNTADFTKYSFPSKIIEYMLSGRPIIAYKLDGIPDEYDKFLNYPTDNSPIALANLIESMLDTSEEILMQQGVSARQFVLEKKNYVMQTKKILSLFRDV